MAISDKQKLARLYDVKATRAARASLLAFVLYTFDGDFKVNWHHRLICEKLEAFERGDIKRLIVLCPPRHTKSELVSRMLPSWILGRNPDAKIIACSYGADLALDMSRDAKRIVGSDAYQRVFPGTKLPSSNVVTDARHAYKNTADQWQIIDHKGQYLARGVGGGVTGKGGNFLIVDDPVKDAEEASSPTYREKVWQWYTKVLKTRRAKDAGIAIVMTRWHQDDLVGRLLERAEQSEKADQWTVIRLPAIAEDEPAHPDDPRAPGEALWPAFKGVDEWAQDKHEDPAGFASLGQQRPSAEGGVTLKATWLENRYKVLPVAGGGEFIWAMDCRAGGKGLSTSNAVVQLWFRSNAQKGTLYLVDQRHGRWDLPETLAVLRSLAGVSPWNRARTKLIEAAADGRAVIDTLKSEIPGLIPVKPSGSKESRVRAVAPFWQAGNIFIPDDSMARDWVGEFIQEHITFPAATRDDMVDTSSMAIAHFLVADGLDPIEQMRRIVGA